MKCLKDTTVFDEQETHVNVQGDSTTGKNVEGEPKANANEASTKEEKSLETDGQEGQEREEKLQKKLLLTLPKC